MIVDRVWYDPATLLLRKREVIAKSLQNDNDWPKITEVYDRFTLNADILDERFKLPEEKK